LRPDCGVISAGIGGGGRCDIAALTLELLHVPVAGVAVSPEKDGSVCAAGRPWAAWPGLLLATPGGPPDSPPGAGAPAGPENSSKFWRELTGPPDQRDRPDTGQTPARHRPDTGQTPARHRPDIAQTPARHRAVRRSSVTVQQDRTGGAQLCRQGRPLRARPLVPGSEPGSFQARVAAAGGLPGQGTGAGQKKGPGKAQWQRSAVKCTGNQIAPNLPGGPLPCPKPQTRCPYEQSI
jgi:hypothetical protein